MTSPPAIGCGPAPAYHPPLGQALGQRPGRDPAEARQPPHLEQQEVLLGLDAGRLYNRSMAWGASGSRVGA
jgi:hypothetical protein